jgi:hypothetical protein
MRIKTALSGSRFRTVNIFAEETDDEKTIGVHGAFSGNCGYGIGRRA